MTIEQYLHRLCQNILRERFNWRKYLFTALGAVPEALSAHKALRGRSGIYRIGE